MEPKVGDAAPLGATNSIDLPEEEEEEEEEGQEGAWQNKQTGAVASVTTTTTAAAMNRSKSSFLNPGGADIPLVELKLENVTYTPVTNRAAQSTSCTCTSSCFDKKQQQQQQQQHTTVLHNISTTISPGKLTAWMGPSGSGKTSLLSIAAGLISPSTSISSSSSSSSNTKSGAHSKIYVNGELGRIPKRFVGIVWQEDLLLSNLTVYENIYYAARLKTSDAAAAATTTAAAGRGNATSSSSSDKISKAQVRAVVDETIQELGLTHVRDMLVGNALMAGAGAGAASSTTNKSSSNKSSSSSSGNTRRGVSGGERKRVSVACELVVRPSLLLLDEPTSGLDSSMALSLIKTLRYLADTAGHSIAVVIHQPRTTIFNLFDTVLLLSGGHVVYNGPTAHVRTYLESCPDVSPLPAETGIADWIMDVIIHDEKGRRRGSDGEGTGSGGGGERRLPSCWEEHQKKLLSSSGDDSGTTETPSTSEADDFHNRRKSTLLELQAVPKFETSFRTQLLLLTQRTHKQQRGERLTATAVYVQLVNLFFTALFWWRMPDTTGWIFERNSLLFFMLIAQSNGIVIAAVTVFQRERALLQRERAKKMYGVGAYFLAKTVSDMTNNVILPLMYCIAVYWTAGLRPTFPAFLKFVLNLYLTFSTAQSMGLMMSIVIPSMQLSLVLAPPITLFFMIMGGFYIPFESMHPGVEWLSWLSFARYAFTALIVNEYQDRDIPCATNDVSISFGADSGQCPLPGEAVINSLGIQGVSESFWFNMAMVLLLQIFFRVAAYMLLRRS